MRWLASFAAALPVLACAAAAGSATPSVELAFPSTRAPDLHDEVYLVDTRTGSRNNLSRNPTADGSAVVSPDRSRIAFVSDRGGREAIWLVNLDGTGLRRVHAPLGEAHIRSVRWSPGGRWLAFQVEVAGAGATYVVRSGGGTPRRLSAGWFGYAWVSRTQLAVAGTEGVAVYETSGRLVWQRPGGLAAVSTRGEIAVVTATGLEVLTAAGVRRARVPRGSRPAAWSPDGSMLAFSPTPSEQGVSVLGPGSRVRALSRQLYLRGWAPDGNTLLTDTALLGLDGRTTPTPISGLAWSPDGTNLAGVDRLGRVSLWRQGSAPRALTERPLGGSCPVQHALAWVDERRLVVSTGRGGQQDADLWTSDRNGRSLRRLRRDVNWAAYQEWSPDGSRLVYSSGPVHTHGGGCSGPLTPQLRVAAADGTRDVALTPRTDSIEDRTPRWSPDGSRIAFSRGDVAGDPERRGVFVIEVTTRATRRLAPGGLNVSWAHDGRRVAFSGLDGGVWVADAEAGNAREIATGERPEWAPDRDRIAYVRDGEVWISDGEGAGARRLSAARPVGDLRWSRNGALLAFADAGGIVVLDRDGAVRRRIASPGAHSPRFSRDGRTLAFVAPVGTWSRGNFSGSIRTELFVADVAGGPARRITRDYAGVGAPSWR